MKLHIQSAKRLYEIILLTLLGVLMYISQVIMAPLPNIEIVSLLIILAARSFGYKSFASVYIFVGCEILTYGINIWVINYLYVWAILTAVVCLIRKIDSTAVYTLISGIFGLIFGTLCSVPYFLTGGFAFGISYIVSGLWFDFLHMAGNIVLTVILYKPLGKALEKALKRYQ